MYDDFSNHGAPEPPQKRRRWEFPEEDTGSRRPPRGSAPDYVDETIELPQVDPLAAYDAPEVMEEIHRTRRRRPAQEEAPAAPFVEEPQAAAETDAPRRRRRSQRRQPAETYTTPSPAQETPTGRRRRRRASTEDYTIEYAESYAPGLDEEDLPDAPDWPDWENPPARASRQSAAQGATKPSLFDRIRGLRGSQGGTEEDAEEVLFDEEPRPKKKGLFGGLRPTQEEFSQPKPKPRVQRDEAYHKPVYPKKKR